MGWGSVVLVFIFCGGRGLTGNWKTGVTGPRETDSAALGAPEEWPRLWAHVLWWVTGQKTQVWAELRIGLLSAPALPVVFFQFPGQSLPATVLITLLPPPSYLNIGPSLRDRIQPGSNILSSDRTAEYELPMGSCHFYIEIDYYCPTLYYSQGRSDIELTWNEPSLNAPSSIKETVTIKQLASSSACLLEAKVPHLQKPVPLH